MPKAGMGARFSSRERQGWYLRLKGIVTGGEQGMEYLQESLEMFREMGRKGDMEKSLHWIEKLKGKEMG